MSWNYFQTPNKSAYRLAQLYAPSRFSVWRWVLEIFFASGDSKGENSASDENGVLISELFEIIEDKNTIEIMDIFQINTAVTMLEPQEISVDKLVQLVSWSDLHIRHKFRIIFSIVLLLGGVVDLFLKVFGFHSFGDVYSDVLWIIGAFGLLGTSVYLAIEA